MPARARRRAAATVTRATTGLSAVGGGVARNLETVSPRDCQPLAWRGAQPRNSLRGVAGRPAQDNRERTSTGFHAKSRAGTAPTMMQSNDAND